MGNVVQGSVRIRRQLAGKDGADAVVWRIEPSASVVKKSADGTVSDYIIVKGYKTAGAVTTVYDFLSGSVLEASKTAQYSVDGGEWTDCALIRQKIGTQIETIGVGATATTLTKVGNYIKFRMLEGSTVVAESAELKVVRDGDKGDSGDKGDKGDSGEDAEVWQIDTSMTVLRVKRGYTFDEPLVVSATKTVGSRKEKYTFMFEEIGGTNPEAEYSCDETNEWLPIETLSEGDGIHLIIKGAGITAETLNAQKPAKRIKLRVTLSGSVVAEKSIEVVGDGLTVRGPQMWNDIEEGYQFYDSTPGNEYFDTVYYDGVFYSCKQSHTKDTTNAEPGTDSGAAYWQETQKQDIVATRLLLAQRALIENLYVNELETVKNGETMIHIHDRLIEVYGTSAKKNIEIGVDEAGMAVLKYFDNSGNLLYNLGPDGIRFMSLTPEMWIDTVLTTVCDLGEEPCDHSEVWGTSGNITNGTAETLYRFVSSRINGNATDAAHDGLTYSAQGDASDESRLVGGWYVGSHILNTDDIYMRKNVVNSDWLLPATAEQFGGGITESNYQWLIGIIGKRHTKIYCRVLLKYEDGKASRYNYYFPE